MVPLTQVVAMNEDKAMAAKWLSENADLVLKDLNRIHNMHMDMALMHSILTDNRKGDLDETLKERVEKVKEILLENA
jgi:hypothetical protein